MIKKWISIFLSFFSASGMAYEESPFNLPYGVTPISHEIYHTHMVMIYICAVIGILVFGMMIYSLLRYRRSQGAVARRDGDQNLALELTWTVIPALILVIMAVPATKTLIRMHDNSAPALNIKITGYQWYWQYQYLDQGIGFYSRLSTPQAQIDGTQPRGRWFLLEVDHPLVVPIHQKIRFLVTSNDVIHSWWVPTLGVKQDAVPGYVNETWTYIEQPGIYRGQCGELCGSLHAFMPIVVQAVTAEEFKKWLKNQGATFNTVVEQVPQQVSKLNFSELMQRGKSGYEQYCAACHQSNGEGIKPAFPAMRGDRVVIGPVKTHIQLVLQGVPGTAMQAFGPQLDDVTLAAIITYERNAWGNAHLTQKSTVQPEDVVKYRPQLKGNIASRSQT